MHTRFRAINTGTDDTMADLNKSSELPARIKDHLSRYIAMDGADRYLWDASLGEQRHYYRRQLELPACCLI